FLERFLREGARGLRAGGLGDDHMRKLRSVFPGLVPLEPPKLHGTALAISMKRNAGESRGSQGRLQSLAVVEKLMPPAVKRLVQLQAVVDLHVRGCLRSGSVMRRKHPVEIRRREPQNSDRG